MTIKLEELAEAFEQDLEEALAELNDLQTWTEVLPEEDATAETHPRHKCRGNWFQAVCMSAHLAVEAAGVLGRIDKGKEENLTAEIDEAFRAYKERREDATQDPDLKSLRTIPEEIETVSQLIRDVVSVLEPLLPPTQ